MGRRGIFITGSIKPKLAGVKVTVTHKDGTADPIVIETPDSGEFKQVKVIANDYKDFHVYQ